MPCQGLGTGRSPNLPISQAFALFPPRGAIRGAGIKQWGPGKMGKTLTYTVSAPIRKRKPSTSPLAMNHRTSKQGPRQMGTRAAAIGRLGLTWETAPSQGRHGNDGMIHGPGMGFLAVCANVKMPQKGPQIGARLLQRTSLDHCITTSGLRHPQSTFCFGYHSGSESGTHPALLNLRIYLRQASQDPAGRQHPFEG
jgi:hypothetical protein